MTFLCFEAIIKEINMLIIKNYHRKAAVIFMMKKWLKKLNIIDYILIGILLFSLAGITVKILVNANDGENTRYQFTFVCESAPEEILSRAPQEGICTDAENNIALGQLTSLFHREEPQALRFTSEIKGAASDHGILIGGKQYVVGQKLTVNLGSIQLPVYIADIQTISKTQK